MVEWKKLENVASYYRGVTYNKKQEVALNSGGTKILRANNITLENNSINYDDVKEIDSSVKVRNDQWLYPEDILICAGSGSKEHVGKVAFVNTELGYAFGGFMGKIVTKQNLKSRYLFHILCGSFFKDYLKIALNSTTINNLNSEIINNFLIPIPSLEEQTQIVGILDTFTSAIDNLKEQIAQRRKQYEYYRDQLLDLEGKPEVEKKSLSNCCNLITKQTGFDYSKTIKPSLTTTKHDDTIPFIQNKDFEGTRINLNTDFYIPISIAQKFPKILLNERILLLSISGKIGNVGLYDLNSVSFVGGAICVCRLNNEVNGRYILYYLLSHKGQNSLFSSVKAASHSNITVESIRETPIPLPPLSEQQRIVSILDTFEASIQNLEAQLKEREQQYEYYRNKLLTFE